MNPRPLPPRVATGLAALALAACCPELAFAGSPPPSGLHAVVRSGAVDLGWDLAPAARGYHVYRSEDGSSYRRVNAEFLLDATFLADGLTDGTEYFFYVTSVDRNGAESSPSAPITAIPSASVGAVPRSEAPPSFRSEAPRGRPTPEMWKFRGAGKALGWTAFGVGLGVAYFGGIAQAGSGASSEQVWGTVVAGLVVAGGGLTFAIFSMKYRPERRRIYEDGGAPGGATGASPSVAPYLAFSPGHAAAGLTARF